MPLPSPDIVIRRRFVCLDGFVISRLSHVTITLFLLLSHTIFTTSGSPVNFKCSRYCRHLKQNSMDEHNVKNCFQSFVLSSPSLIVPTKDNKQISKFLILNGRIS